MNRFFSLANRLVFFLFFALFFSPFSTAAAKSKPPRLVFIPHDSRPISSDESAYAVRELGYEVLIPPKDILGNRGTLGDPEKVWAWLEEVTAKQKPAAAILSTDTLIYGSLVGSRKHSYTEAELAQRVSRLKAFHDSHRRMPIYAFGSIMRTPRNGEASGAQEPSYYQNYGADIFRYTALTDKEETTGLTSREKKEIKFLGRLIPKAALDDWLERRAKNFSVSKNLIDLARQGVFQYLAFGRDDNAPYSQTHMEGRKLSAYGKDLGNSRFQAMAGIDEFAMLMLSRAVNNREKELPFVYVHYNWGRGPQTVPSYSDEPIEKTLHDHIIAIGAVAVNSPKKADLVLLVNTDPTGQTLEANTSANDGKPRNGTRYFVELVEEHIAAGFPVAIADISFGNGADNALMQELKKRGLLFRLRAYAGWNTATNSSGFVLSQGTIAKLLTDESRDRLLLSRYLDDWLYQSNVRTIMGRQLGWLRGSGAYSTLDAKKEAVEARTTRLMQRFIDDNLPPFAELEKLRVVFPWNRMFEAKFEYGNH